MGRTTRDSLIIIISAPIAPTTEGLLLPHTGVVHAPAAQPGQLHYKPACAMTQPKDGDILLAGAALGHAQILVRVLKFQMRPIQAVSAAQPIPNRTMECASAIVVGIVQPVNLPTTGASNAMRKPQDPTGPSVPAPLGFRGTQAAILANAPILPNGKTPLPALLPVNRALPLPPRTPAVVPHVPGANRAQPTFKARTLATAMRIGGPIPALVPQPAGLVLPV